MVEEGLDERPVEGVGEGRNIRNGRLAKGRRAVRNVDHEGRVRRRKAAEERWAFSIALIDECFGRGGDWWEEVNAWKEVDAVLGCLLVQLSSGYHHERMNETYDKCASVGIIVLCI